MSISTAELNSPFVDSRSFEAPTEAAIRRLGLASPFVEAFALEPSRSVTDSRDAVRRVLRAQLYSEELDSAIYELVRRDRLVRGKRRRPATRGVRRQDASCAAGR